MKKQTVQPIVLIVEPDVVLADVYAKALNGAGYDVDLAHDAQSALACANVRKPDAVILELQLPAHSGIEFLHEFHSYTDWQNVPIVVHSYIHPNDLAKMQSSLQNELSVEAFCYKPRTSLQKLVSQVGATLRNSQRAPK